MNEATIALMIMSVLILLVFLGFLVWGIKSGQFKNVEEPKFQIFRTPVKNNDEKLRNGEAKQEVKQDATRPL